MKVLDVVFNAIRSGGGRQYLKRFVGVLQVPDTGLCRSIDLRQRKVLVAVRGDNVRPILWCPGNVAEWTLRMKWAVNIWEYIFTIFNEKVSFPYLLSCKILKSVCGLGITLFGNRPRIQVLEIVLIDVHGVVLQNYLLKFLAQINHLFPVDIFPLDFLAVPSHLFRIQTADVPRPTALQVSYPLGREDEIVRVACAEGENGGALDVLIRFVAHNVIVAVCFVAHLMQFQLVAVPKLTGLVTRPPSFHMHDPFYDCVFAVEHFHFDAGAALC